MFDIRESFVSFESYKVHSEFTILIMIDTFAIIVHSHEHHFDSKLLLGKHICLMAVVNNLYFRLKGILH